MQDFVHQKNLELYRKRLLETTDQAKRDVLVKLLAEEVKLLAEEEVKDFKLAAERKATRPSGTS
ncbi:MAG: hypothetical protein Q8M19_04055 [Reyranella sp.]|nr:hypothetical protein [Reyranella sp.]